MEFAKKYLQGQSRKRSNESMEGFSTESIKVSLEELFFQFVNKNLENFLEDFLTNALTFR